MIIDCDKDPFVPYSADMFDRSDPQRNRWSVESHVKGGQLEWNLSRAGLYLCESQRNNKVITGEELRKELKDQPLLNANILDTLVAHRELIPNSWYGKFVFFWGTIYCVAGVPTVRFFLYGANGGYVDCVQLYHKMEPYFYAAILKED
ncbi:MAG: hypothetical protein HZA35_03370 [Parcubacteria group bacterium]|nr:hypothetical protein [Parcubacteria group bacterium]